MIFYYFCHSCVIIYPMVFVCGSYRKWYCSTKNYYNIVTVIKAVAAFLYFTECLFLFLGFYAIHTKHCKQTREQKLEKKRMAERLRYQRLKSDPIKRERLRKKERRKYINKKMKVKLNTLQIGHLRNKDLKKGMGWKNETTLKTPYVANFLYFHE